MNQENLAKLLDWLLSERMREPPGEFSNAALRRVRRITSWILKACRRKPDDIAAATLDGDLIARIHILPAPIQEALRRYYVFGEAEESISISMNMNREELHRLRLEARNFVLGRRARRSVSLPRW
jgi:hypothetical protein